MVSTKFLNFSLYKPPRNPIVLAHGLLGFDVLGPPALQLHYWRGIAEALRVIGATVYVTKVPRVADVSIRAKALKAQLEKMTAGQERSELNIIGHSMGGLDSRYMVSKLLSNQGKAGEGTFRVASLTTVATPHKGSPIARWIAFPFVPTIEYFDYRAFTNLTPEYMRDTFNPNVPNVDGVRYYSWGADAESLMYERSAFYPLRWTWKHIRGLEGPNDGLVSLESSEWGLMQGCVLADHLDLINFWKRHRGRLSRAPEQENDYETPAELAQDRKIALEAYDSLSSSFNAIEFYLQVATTLAKDGH